MKPRSTRWAGLALLVASPQEPAPPPLPAETVVTVERVIDGDTLQVLLGDEHVTLRIACVDTEEKIAGRASASPTKPETVFGQETTLWAQALFASLGAPARVGLAFPEGRRRDAFGRLLGHVLLPDGRDYDLLLVEEGRSPYFNKYGNCGWSDAAFRAAQGRARAAGKGIWNPATNRARSAGAPSATRPYAELLPWWDARAAAIERFRARASASVLASDDAVGLRRIVGRRVTLFGTIARFYEERDGSLTVLLAGSRGPDAVRVAVRAAERTRLEPSLRASTLELRQNFLYVSGRLGNGPRGLVLVTQGPEDWVAAEPAWPPAPR